MYCRRCGVELEPEFSQCPLCGSTDHTEQEPEMTEYHLDEPAPVEPVLRQMVRRSIGGIGMTASIILLMLDLGTDGVLSWSPVAIVPVITGTALVVIALLFTRWSHIFFGSMTATITMLALLDLLSNGGLDWFVPIAIPLTLAAGVVVELHRFLLPRLPGVVKGSVILVGAGIMTAMVDMTITLHTMDTVGLSWSRFVLLATLPAAGLLILLHRTLLRYIDLRRRFHI
ncbi:MAG TPA: hypothetical protein VJ932_10220 [Alkalispirochaeta sp.]|nr:hypothetical protein [Alkalispirochaeta sp.]